MIGVLRDAFDRHAAAVAYVEVVDRLGDRYIKRPFHIGDPAFVTEQNLVLGEALSPV